MKKLLLAFAATAALCFGFASCTNEAQDVNVVNWDSLSSGSDWNYLCKVSGTGSSSYTSLSSGETTTNTMSISSKYSYATIEKSYKSGDNYTVITVDYHLYADTSKTSSAGLDGSLTFYKINGKWYDHLGGPDAVDITSRFTSGTPESSSFTYTFTDDEYSGDNYNVTWELTFTRK